MASSRKAGKSASSIRGTRGSGRKVGPNIKNAAYAILVLLLIYSVFVTITYLNLQSLITSPSITSFPIKFYVNSTAFITSNLIGVPLNQTFCPQNSTIRALAVSTAVSPYYTSAAVSQNFIYTFFYNGTSPSLYNIGITKPFKLNYFKAITVQTSQCQGYPYALNALVVGIQAPNSTYVGNIYLVRYGKN